MTRRGAAALSALAVAAASACGSPLSHAEPSVPQQNSSCANFRAGTLTRLTESNTVLQCRDGQWQVFTDAYPSSDDWLTYGPELILRGQARRNPEIRAGSWTGTPRDQETQCSATQSVVITPGQMAPPQVSAGHVGQPLEVTLTTQLATIALSGNCLWHRDF